MFTPLLTRIQLSMTRPCQPAHHAFDGPSILFRVGLTLYPKATSANKWGQTRLILGDVRMECLLIDLAAIKRAALRVRELAPQMNIPFTSCGMVRSWMFRRKLVRKDQRGQGRLIKDEGQMELKKPGSNYLCSKYDELGKSPILFP